MRERCPCIVGPPLAGGLLGGWPARRLACSAAGLLGGWPARRLACSAGPDGNATLIFRQLNLIFRRAFVEVDGSLVDAFDLPTLLGVDPGVGLGFVGAAHTAHDAAAQATAQVFQRDAL